MKTCNLCANEKPLEDFHNNHTTKDGKETYCKECKKAKCRDYYQKNRDKKLAACSEYSRNNRQHKAKYMRLRRAGGARPEGRTTECNNGADYEGLRDKRNAFLKQHRERYPERKNAQNAKRRAAKLHRTPSWANDFFITEIYELAQLRSAATGIEHHVDHKIPLQGKLVSGLHVEGNLQIITATENLSKKHTYEVAA